MKGPHGFALWMNVNVNHGANLTESIFGHVPVYNFDVKRMKLVYKKDVNKMKLSGMLYIQMKGSFFMRRGA